MQVFKIDVTREQLRYINDVNRLMPRIGRAGAQEELWERLSDITEIPPDWLKAKIGEGFILSKWRIGAESHTPRTRGNTNVLILRYPVSQEASGRFVEYLPHAKNGPN